MTKTMRMRKLTYALLAALAFQADKAYAIDGTPVTDARAYKGGIIRNGRKSIGKGKGK